MRKRTLLLAAALTSGLLTALPPASAAAAPAGRVADFTCDGFRDVAIGADGAAVAGRQSAGAVILPYGSPSGSCAARPRD